MQFPVKCILTVHGWCLYKTLSTSTDVPKTYSLVKHFDIPCKSALLLFLFLAFSQDFPKENIWCCSCNAFYYWNTVIFLSLFYFVYSNYSDFSQRLRSRNSVHSVLLDSMYFSCISSSLVYTVTQESFQQNKVEENNFLLFLI